MGQFCSGFFFLRIRFVPDFFPAEPKPDRKGPFPVEKPVLPAGIQFHENNSGYVQFSEKKAQPHKTGLAHCNLVNLSF